jgi:two-component system sensor histidine kinase KdpD
VELLVRRAAPVGAAPPGLVLAVRDRGPGIAPAWRSRIFEVFQRGEPGQDGSGTDSRPRSGTGVGLAVCRAVARAHGGELVLRGRNHGGSSFECHLPGAVQPVPAEGSP